MKKRHRLLIALAATALAVIALLTYLLWSGYREAVQVAETTTRGYAAVLATRLDATLRRADAILQRVAHSVPQTALNKDAVPWYSQINRQMQSDLVNFPEIAGLRITDAAGNILYAAGSATTIGANISDRSYFRLLRDNPRIDTTFSDVVVARSSRQRVITFNKAIRDEQRNFLGLVVAVIDLNYFQKLHQSLSVGNKGTVGINRSDNFTQVVRWPPAAADMLNVPLQPDAPTRSMINNKVRTGTAAFTSTRDGVARIYSLHALDVYPFYVTVSAARDEVLAGWRERATIASLATLLVLGLLFGLQHQLWRADADQAWLAGIVDASNDAIISRDLDGRIVSWNRGAEAMFGYTAAEVIGRSITVIVPEDRRHELRLGQTIDSTVRPRSNDSVRRTKDGREIDVSISIAPIRGVGGRVNAVALIYRDITTRAQAEEARGRLAAVTESTNDSIYIRDGEGRIVYWNDGARRLYGYTADEARGKESTFLIPPEQLQERHRNWQHLQQGHAVENYETVRLRKDGTPVEVSVGATLVKDSRGRTLGYATIARDVSERKKAERHIEQLATRDALTGLSNRSRLTEQMDAAIAHAARSHTQVAVMFVDLDQFKSVNDTLGHAAGDDLLRECAKRLLACVREVDIVARLGGDEFVVLLTGVADPGSVSQVAERMLKLLTTPYQLQAQDAQVSASIGICFYPADGEDVTTLMKNADIAMYHAKERGRNNYQFFSEEMNQRVIQRLQLIRELRSAVENDEFILHYQPQIGVESGAVHGAEALLRWQHPTRGLLSPLEFIAAAEESSLIVPIGLWVLNHACHTVKTWHAKNMGIPHVVINVSAAQLDTSLVTSVREMLVKHDIPPSWLVLEITETLLMKQVEEAISILRRIRELGVRIAMDDFGTGYSSLSVLQRLPLDMLKIDRSFVRAIADEVDNTRACAIIGAIVAIAKELNLAVVAEGVETTMQLAFLRTLRCDTYQGYLYSMPVDTMTLEARWAAPRDHTPGTAAACNSADTAMTSATTLELPVAPAAPTEPPTEPRRDQAS